MSLIDWIWKVNKKIYPENCTCYLCTGDVFYGETFCDACRRELPYNTTYCERCGREVVQEGYCVDCKHEQPLFSKGRSLFAYEGKAVALIHQFKTGDPGLANAFAKEGRGMVSLDFADADCIVFTPIGEDGLDKRGYNQAELLAKRLGEYCNKKVEEIFVKEKKTAEQKSLTKEERAKNLCGVFRLTDSEAVKDKRVLLVDDVLTTGATADELTRLLLDAGAKKVYLFTVGSVRLKKDD
jgi:ComF family protein